MQMALVKTLWLLVSIISWTASVAFEDEIPSTIVEVPPFNRANFPPDFIFGSASAAYQYEGYREGRGQNIWDTFSHLPGKILDGKNGDVAIDEYHRYQEDVGIMQYMNLDAFRFSISWSRILPTGRRSGGINEEGVEYYRSLIRELQSKGIKPFVTIFHWDLPQALEDEYGGFLSKKIVDDFRDYADVLFEKFGKEVKHWITINEPSIFTENGYAIGRFAPGRCSIENTQCLGGDNTTEPYIVAHHILLAHAATVKLYKQNYQKIDPNNEGKIGITLAQGWVMPYSNSTQDKAAAQRALDFSFGWFMDPITKGDYPRSMIIRVGDRLPEFDSTESELLKGSFDFIGLNYYTSFYAQNIESTGPNFATDSGAKSTSERDGKALGPRADSGNGWIYVYPKGLRDILLYIKDKYKNPLVFITENGMDEFNDPSLSVGEAVLDHYRIDYYYRHLYYLHSAITENDANVQGYFAWSLLDNFEWSSGYTSRFGLNFVDYENGLKRYQKLSATWFRNFLKKN